MQKLIYKLAGFLGGVALVLFSYFTQPSAEINKSSNVSSYSVPDSQFQIGILNGAQYFGYTYIHDSLNFNIWHRYTEPTGYGWDSTNYQDRYDNPISSYQDIVTGRIDANKNKDMRTYMDRPIIDYIVAGQRIDYQCEIVPANDPYWFWAYNYADTSYSKGIFDTTDMSNHGLYGDGSRTKVKYCQRDNQNPGSNACWLDSSVKANRELSFVQTYSYMNDNAWDWYIMPRIRIDSAYAADLNHYNDPVCRIKITGWRGDSVININLNVSHFRGPIDSIYRGNYKENYYFGGTTDSLKLDKSLITQYFVPDNNGFPFFWPDPSCLVDIKIYWSGKCDTWFDRVRVENFPAHDYLTLKNKDIVGKVTSEITWSMQNYNGIPNYFYFEECQFSHFPAIKELNKQIMTQTNNQNCLIIWLNYNLFLSHMPYYWDKCWYANDLKKYLYEDFGLRTIIMGAYALEGFDYNDYYGRISYHPRTISTNLLPFNKETGILSHDTTPSGYDNWLQTHLDNPHRDGTKLISMNILMDSLSKETDMRIINCPQAHLTWSPGHSLKEPSREELELQTDLAITYNAKGIMYFGYESFNEFNNKDIYQRGIININGSARHNSEYGQDKFGKIKELSAKLQKWGPYIISFDPDYTHSYIYRLSSDRTALNSNSYFIYFSTLKPGSGTPDCGNQEHTPDNIPSGFTYDCEDSTYLQIATFENSEPNTKYFMVVNRRCSPFINENNVDNRGGKRKVRAYLHSNYSAFIEFKKMKIVKIEDDTEEYVFETEKPGYVELGFFMPGEGKLYKIIPN